MSLKLSTINSFKLKILIRYCLPPFILLIYRNIRYGSRAYRDYSELPHYLNDYSDAELIENIVAKTKKFALDSKNQRLVQFDNILPMLILALREAGSATNIIDFGGAAGAHYFTAKNYLGIDAKIKWKIIETPNMRHRASRAISSETQLIFERSLNDAVIADEDNLVIANFSVCYIEDPYAILRQMLELGCRKILLMQTPFSIDELQKPVLFQKSRLKDHGVQSVKISKSNKKIFTPITILELPKLVERLKGVGRISFYAQQSKDIFFKNGSYDAYAILIEKCDK